MLSPYQIKNKTFILINDPILHSGQFNMEFDKWLFDYFLKQNGKNSLRIYEWNKPAITYGQFQDIEKEINFEQIKHDNIEIVKRPTGGRAILHSDEITFSMSFSAQTISPYTFRNCYYFVAEIILEAFQKLELSAEINTIPQKYQDKTLCFQSLSQYEIIDKDHNKLVGIAQLFKKEGVLIQGSIPLKENKNYFQYFNLKKEKDFTNELITKKMSKEEVRDAIVKTAASKLKLLPL